MRLQPKLEPRTQSTVSLRNRISWIGGAGIVMALSILFITNTPEGETSQLIPIVGRDGTKTVSAPETVLNQYTSVVSDVSAGDVSILVNDINELSNGTALVTDDLVLIMQMQGASITTDNDSSFGTISSYNNAGHYEFAYVSGTSGNQVLLSCGLEQDYTANGHVQLVRVPQYTTLTISEGASVTAEAWDGTTGGIVAVVAQQTIQISGTISVEGQGFRGGVVDNTTSWNQRGFYFNSASYAGEKGEGIAGYHTEYDAISARYGRGAIANGGGGGNAHNAGGGGGANGNNGIAWNGQGNMCQSCTGNGAWQLDSGYIKFGNAYTASGGGGRGGYTYASANQDALTVAPEDAAWSGDQRRQLGGMGGRPVSNEPASRLFMGGGGGAGDGNNSAANDGAAGGGIVLLLADVITGSGSILASGSDAAPTGSSHNDAPGGGGAGGTIVIKANNAAGISLVADGGAGGNQLITNNESEGPGGGGGGGYIALPSDISLTASVAGGSGGISTSASVTEFPSNGATDGGAGEFENDLGYIPFCTSYDHDGDGIADETDLDDDNDGIPDWEELGCSMADFMSGACADPAAKTANGIPLYQDASACAGGSLTNGVCPEYDQDQDGIPDFLDRDSDNDGITDLIEAGGVDESGSGTVDCFSRSATQFYVTLTITDDAGNISTLTELVSVGSSPPIAAYSISPGFVNSSLSISLDASSSSDNGSITGYSWDFGDGNTAAGSTASHTFAAEGTYAISLTVTDNDGLTDTYQQQVTVANGDPCALSPGSITREYWSGISGTSISNLTSHANYPDNPTSTNTLSSFSSSRNIGDNYGTRVRGYLVPPATGDYHFTVTADDHVSLYLSTDGDEANKTEICGHTGWTSVGQTNRYSSQRSSAIALSAGESYYIELLHKEGGGGDHFDVYWERPDDPTLTIIDGAYLAPWEGTCVDNPPTPLITASAWSGSHPLTISFSAASSADTDGSIVSYEWSFGDGSTASGATTSHTFEAPLVLTDSDLDGWCDAYDIYDNGGAGYSAGTELPYLDSDLDGVKDFLDLDSDNDGVPDVMESGNGDADTDGNGMLGAYGSLPADADGDGIADLVDPVDDSGGGQTGTASMRTGSNSGNNRPSGFLTGDFDSDGIPNYRDVDADDDGIADWMEAQPSGTNSPTDGLTTPGGTDSDGDGIDDAFDIQNREDGSAMAGSALSPPDTEEDGNEDYLDTDSDGDEISDAIEGHDADENGVADITPSGVDSDGDGLDDAFDGLTDLADASYSTSNARSSSAAVQDSDEANDRDWRDPSGAPVSMPVEWMYFEGEKQGGTAVLKWATAREINSFYFEVERSVDGQSYEALDQVQAAGFTEAPTEYSYRDESLGLLGAPAVIYRLKQVDLDGAFEYSNRVELKLEGGAQPVEMSIFPNPATVTATVRFSTIEPGDWQLRVLNVNGQQIFSEPISTMGGTMDIPVQCGSWGAGYYIINLTDGTRNQSVKLQVK